MGKQKFNFQALGQSPAPAMMNNDKAPAPLNNTTVASIVKQLDSTEKNPFEIKLIPRSRIRMNKKNCYPIEEIESLSKSILEFGLQQNLVVIYSSEEDKYIIETGHRRFTALNMLIDKYSGKTDYPEKALYMKNVAPYEKGFPCKVIYLEDGIEYDVSDNTDLSTIPTSVIDSEIRLYITNEEIRAKNPVRTAQVVARLKQLYDAKNASLNHSDKINVNNEIADNLNISSRQVAKYNSIDNLIPELKGLFINNNISLTNATGYAQLSHEEQEQIYKIFLTHEEMSSKQINELVKNNNELSLEIKRKEAEINALSSSHSDNGTANDELINLKNQLAELRTQKNIILNENSALKEQLLASRNLKAAYDSLIAAASRFILDSKKVTISDINAAELDKAIALSEQISSLNLF